MVKMPVCFVGHGSPMNAVENNEFTLGWETLSQDILTPKAILMISAHWVTQGSRTSDEAKPQMIYDMSGFPQALYQVQYPCPGSPQLAARLRAIFPTKVTIDRTWGLDHGAWSVLCHMYPKHDIPVIQLSIDQTLSMKDYYDMGRKLHCLREEGVLIIASGNIVHNLALVQWDNANGTPFADTFDRFVKKAIFAHETDKLIDYEKAPGGRYAVPTPEHYAPLLYILGATDEIDPIRVYNEKRTMGSLSMTSYLIG